MTDKEILALSKEKLPIRTCLNIPPTANFGLEIEMENIDKATCENIIKPYIGWYDKDDASLKGKGVELVSPVIHNNTPTWKILLSLSNSLKKHHLTFENSSFQVTLDTSYNHKELLYLIKLLIIYQKEIYHFSTGFNSRLRECYDIYAGPLYNFYFDYVRIIEKEEEIVTRLINTKDYLISFKTIKDVISKYSPISRVEFRSANGTVDYFLWQNYINTFYHLLESIKYLDIDLLNYRFSKLSPYTIFSKDSYLFYRPERALEFANLIFTDDTDKIYFLNQYTKPDISEKPKTLKKGGII